MTQTDMNFPVITYQAGANPRSWGEQHGESCRTGIQELVAIRRQLLHEKTAV